MEEKQLVNVMWFYDDKIKDWFVKVGEGEPMTGKEFWDKYGEEV